MANDKMTIYGLRPGMQLVIPNIFLMNRGPVDPRRGIYWSRDGKVSYNEFGQRLDSLGHVAYDSDGNNERSARCQTAANVAVEITTNAASSPPRHLCLVPKKGSIETEKERSVPASLLVIFNNGKGAG